MTSDDQLLIEKWAALSTGTIQIRLILTIDDRSRAFETFYNGLKKITENIKAAKIAEDGLGFPSIRIADNFICHFVPSGSMLLPFLEALSLFQKGSVSWSNKIEANFKPIKMPAELKLFVAHGCPFCPQRIRELIPLAAASKQLKLTIIDGTLFPELAEQDNIKSAPTLLLGQHFRWTGLTPLDEILDAINDRDPTRLSPASLEDMVKDGNAAQVAGMMLERKTIFPAFFEVLMHEKWSVRLGAMVVMEEIIEKDFDLAGEAADYIMDRLPDMDDQLKGDMIYILGECCGTEIIPFLEQIFHDSNNNELKDAVDEAIHNIQNRNQDTKSD